MHKEFRLGQVVVWQEEGRNTHAWVSGGSTDWFLTEEERAMPPEELAIKINNTWKGGEVYRCSACGKEMKKAEVAGWPLFAGVACPDHWQQHQDKLDKERKAGHVCRRCGCAFSDCSC